MLYLSRVKAMNPTYEQAGRPAVTLDDIKSFRQAGSRCTGHPEYGWTSGVETTTGPLGQGVATSVGMAIAERCLAATYNRPGYDLFSYSIYALCGDGDLMEGISSEAASLAGHLKLANLCRIYDDNHVTIEGPTSITFTEDVAARFLGYGWNVTRVSDANDLEMLTSGYQTFLNTQDRPTLIIVQSHIGYGAPHKHDTRAAHGEPLGSEEVRLTKEFYGWDPDAQSMCLTAFRRISKSSLAAVVQQFAQPGRICLRPIASSTQTSPIKLITCSAVSCPKAGTALYRPSLQMQRVWLRATRRARC